MLPSHHVRSSAKSSAKNNGKNNAKSSGPSRAWNRVNRYKRLRRHHRRLQSPTPPAIQRPATKALPTWLSALKRRSASLPARHARRAVRHAQQPRPRRHAAIQRPLRRRAILGPASKNRRPQMPASPTRTKPPSTTRSNKKWRICWGGPQRPEVRCLRTDVGTATVRCPPSSSVLQHLISVVHHPIRSTGLIARPDEDSAAARLMSAKS